MGEHWGQWFRDSFDKILLTGLITGFLAYNLHILHDKGDNSEIQFMNGLINTTLGCLITLVTGKLRQLMATASTKDDPKTGDSVGSLKVKES